MLKKPVKKAVRISYRDLSLKKKNSENVFEKNFFKIILQQKLTLKRP